MASLHLYFGQCPTYKDIHDILVEDLQSSWLQRNISSCVLPLTLGRNLWYPTQVCVLSGRVT